MRFFCFHLMPWPHLPEDFAQRYDSACMGTLALPACARSVGSAAWLIVG
jgi:hypothetical protein